MAVAGTFNALAGELDGLIELTDPRVQVALLNASTMLVMSSDTRDMGIMAPLPKRDPGDHFAYPCDDCGRTDGTHDMEVEH
jgi:hypothetical protein